MRIFISYAKVNRALVEILVEVLREVGHDPWFDYRLQSGQPWQEQLIAAIEAADLFLYALTPDSINSKWCQWEFAEAVHLGKPILPVMMQGRLKLPDTIGSQQCADFTEGRTWQAATRLVNDLRDARPMDPARVPRLPIPQSEPERPTDTNTADLSLPDQLYQEAYAAYRRKAYNEAHDLLVDCLAIRADHADAQGLLRLVERRQKMAAPRRDDRPVVPMKSTPDVDWADVLQQFRESVGFPVPEMVRIPAGPFLMGSDPKRNPEAEENEQPQITVELPEYFMGKYPVTVEEYRAFVDRGGYAESRWWTETGWSSWRDELVTEPLYWNDEEWTGDPRLPMVGVSWHEAYAYTCWLDEMWTAHIKQLMGVNLLHDEFPHLKFRLPTEPEWEKAARGSDGRIYPWGDRFSRDRCNVNETRVGHTTPVGQFSPGGDSPYGCADMAGNVWEWCLTAAGDKDNPHFWSYADGPGTMDNAVNSLLRRVARGGSWKYDPWFARAAVRSKNLPDLWNENWGFRVVCRPPSP